MTENKKVEIPKALKAKGKGGAVVVHNQTTVEKCTCHNEYQDLVYGEGMRLKNAKSNGTRCTVCGQ